MGIRYGFNYHTDENINSLAIMIGANNERNR